MTGHAIVTSESLRGPSRGARGHAPPENFEIWSLGNAIPCILRIVFKNSEHDKMFKVGKVQHILDYFILCQRLLPCLWNTDKAVNECNIDSHEQV